MIKLILTILTNTVYIWFNFMFVKGFSSGVEGVWLWRINEFYSQERMWQPVNNFSRNYKVQWDRAVKEAELGDFTFHDLRHCAINNLRLTGNDHFTIMAISGHRTTSVFRRYNVVTEEELQNVKWKPDEKLGVHIGVHQPRKSSEIGWNWMKINESE